MNDFETWLNRFLTLQGKSLAEFMEHEPKNLQILQIGWQAATEAMQAKLDAQAKQLKILRGFARHAYINTTAVGNTLSVEAFRVFGLIDESGNPTPLLTEAKDE